MTMFASPASASTTDGVKIADLNGHLCLFTPTEVRENVETNMGPADVVVVDVVDLDTNTEHPGTWFFNKAIIGALRPRIGQKVLGRVGQGTPKNPAHSKPWIIVDATTDAAAVKKATDYLAGGLQAPTAAPAAVNEALANIDVSDPSVAALLAKLAGN